MVIDQLKHLSVQCVCIVIIPTYYMFQLSQFRHLSSSMSTVHKYKANSHFFGIPVYIKCISIQYDNIWESSCKILSMIFKANNS